jgi:Arc/MetJ family transcription regulator
VELAGRPLAGATVSSRWSSWRGLRRRPKPCEQPGPLDAQVYVSPVSRTSIGIDAIACAVVMQRYGLTTKRDAVNFALRHVAGEPLSDEARSLRGSGWEGDLDELRRLRA